MGHIAEPLHQLPLNAPNRNRREERQAGRQDPEALRRARPLPRTLAEGWQMVVLQIPHRRKPLRFRNLLAGHTFTNLVPRFTRGFVTIGYQ